MLRQQSVAHTDDQLSAVAVLADAAFPQPDAPILGGSGSEAGVAGDTHADGAAWGPRVHGEEMVARPVLGAVLAEAEAALREHHARRDDVALLWHSERAA